MNRVCDLKLTVRETGLADFVRLYQNQERYLAYCRECDNYGAKWSCPPMGLDTAEFLSHYSYVTVAAVQVEYNEDVVASTPENQVKDVTLDTLMPVKAAFHDAMLNVEREVPGSITLSSGGCTICRQCTRPDGVPCRQPSRMRYSLDSFGFDLSAITEDLLGIKLLWCRGELPAYYTLIHALLERKPMDGVVEQVVLRQLFASDECRENSLRDRSR